MNNQKKPAMIKIKPIKPYDPICGTCKYVDVPRNRKPCCSCSWLKRETYYEQADNEKCGYPTLTKEDYIYNKKKHRWEVGND